MRGDDSWLLQCARGGDEAAFLDLYREHRTSLFRLAWSLTHSGSAAEDIVQECFLILLKGASFQAGQGALRPYLLGMARRLALRRLQLSGRERDELDDASPESSAGPLENLLTSERAALVGDAIAALPALQREALVLFEYEEMSLEEIARIAGVEVGTVKARLHRARESVRRRLEPLLSRCPSERSCR